MKITHLYIRKVQRVGWIALLTFVLSIPALCQQEHFKVVRYGLEHGLSHREILDIEIDSLGFIWLGTPNGLNRFDGHDFLWINRKKNALPTNKVNRILKDVEQRFWLFETEGSRRMRVWHFGIFNPYTHEVIDPVEVFGADSDLNFQDIYAFAANSKGEIVLLAGDKVYLYDGSIQQLDLPMEDSDFLDQIIFTDKKEIVLIRKSPHEGWSIEVLGQDLSHLVHQRFPDAKNISAYVDQQDVYFVVSYLSPKQERIAFYRIQPELKWANVLNHPLKSYDALLSTVDELSAVQKTREHYWVMNTTRQFVVFDEEGENPNDLSTRNEGLKFTHVLKTDQDGQAWVGTQFGLYNIQCKNPKFHTYLTGQSKGANDLMSVRGITVDSSGIIWARTELPRDLWRIDPNTGEESKLSEWDAFQGDINVGGDLGYVCFKAKDGDILFTTGRELYKMNPQTYDYVAYDLGGKVRSFWVVYEDDEGKLWFFDQRNNEIAFLKEGECKLTDARLDPSLHVFVYQVVPAEKKDEVWLITNNGLYLFDLGKEIVIRHFWSGADGNNYFEYDVLHHMHKAADGKLWLATENHGILAVQLEEGRLVIKEHLTVSDGLASNITYAIYGDHTDNLWISTFYGLSQFNKKSKVFRGYIEADGLSHNEFNRISHYQDDKGRIYFGGFNGITAFHPDEFVKDSLDQGAKMVISRFIQVTGDDKFALDKTTELRRSKSITIKPKDRYFRLDFALLDYTEPEKNHYAYKVEGFHNDWIFIRENHLQLSHLPYGNHRLRVRGQNSTGQWSVNELDIMIHVLRPFYAKIWFITLLILLFVAIFPAIYFIRLRSLKKRQLELEKAVSERTQLIETQNKKLQKLDSLKSRFFTNVSHELRTPLTLILGPINGLMEGEVKKDKEKKHLLQLARNSAQDLLKLVNSILDLSKLETGKLSLNEKPLIWYSFIEHIFHKFEATAILNKIDYRLDFNMSKSQVVLLDKEKTATILTNLLANAFKYSGSGDRIVLGISQRDKFIHLEVRDSGRGIDPEDLPNIFDRFYQGDNKSMGSSGGSGIGLALSKELVGVMNGKISAESSPGEGSVFRVLLPYVPVDSEAIILEQKSQETSLDQQIVTNEAESQSSANHTCRLLLVEDHEAMRKYLELILSRYYHVEVASNGMEAIELLEKKLSEAQDVKLCPYDLIISDVMMPGMDGYELLSKLKSNRNWSKIPVLMLTAMAEIEGKLTALRIGVDDYIYKPFEERELLARIDALLRNMDLRKSFRMEEFGKETQLVAEAGESRPDQPEDKMKAFDEWLMKLEEVVNQNIGDFNFSIKALGEKMHLSTRHLQRKIKQCTGLTPQQYILEARLQRARTILESRSVQSIKSLSYDVGLKDEKNFSRRFKERFGKTPSAYLV